MPRALLFDLDDTLYRFTPCDEVAAGAAHALLAHHLDIAEAEFRRLYYEVRDDFAVRLDGQAACHNRTVFFKSMLEQLAGGFRGDLALRMADAYWSAFLDHMEPGPHAHEVLDTLAASHDLALVTNQTTHVQLSKIRQLGFEPYFPVVVTSEECGIEKPAAPMFQMALNALGVDPDAAIMIGDDPVRDIRGAAELGLGTVQTTEFTSAVAESAPKGARPDAVVGSLNELPEVLSRLS